MNEIHKDFSEDVEFGPKLNDDIANIVNNMVKSKASETSSKVRKETHKRHENCEYLRVTKANPEIWNAWNAVPMNIRAHDSALQIIQGLLLTVVRLMLFLFQELWRNYIINTVEAECSSAHNVCANYSHLLRFTQYLQCTLFLN